VIPVRGDDGARAVGATDDDVGFAWSGRRRWTASVTGSSNKDRKICSTVSAAATHSLLSQSRWQGVGLTDLVRHQLAPYVTDANTGISGPNIVLTAAATQAVAMVLHELATNAAKYGALSTSDGRVSVSWDRRFSGDAADNLTIAWREIGGPLVAAPIQSGFGNNLIRNLIPHELGGIVDLAFASDGVYCKIEFPLERL
jgi:two-component sensor histidine kinase